MRFPPEIHENGRCAQVACLWEATARKVGNVHPGADFKNTSYVDFLLSAAAIGDAFVGNLTPRPPSLGGKGEFGAPPFLGEGLGRGRVGHRILTACETTKQLVGQNTNLGIILLLAPLSILERGEPARIQLQQLLAELTVEDAACVYRAIRLANPGGLGDAPEQDVRFEPTVTLLEAMNLAADRDMIARQYANGYADVFDFGVPAFLEGFEKFGNVEAAIVDSQLRWLAAFPDSLISRKNGPSVAEDVRSRAEEVQKFGGIATPEGRRVGVALDEYLRSDGNKLNPGTTADLIAACLFVALREGNVRPSSPFRWDTDEWL